MFAIPVRVHPQHHFTWLLFTGKQIVLKHVTSALCDEQTRAPRMYPIGGGLVEGGMAVPNNYYNQAKSQENERRRQYEALEFVI